MAISVKSKGRSSFDQFWRNIPIIGGLLLFLLFFYVPAGAQKQQTLQPNQVQGNVWGTREPSDPLIGVSVQVLGKTKGAVTDAKGREGL